MQMIENTCLSTNDFVRLSEAMEQASYAGKDLCEMINLPEKANWEIKRVCDTAFKLTMKYAEEEEQQKTLNKDEATCEVYNIATTHLNRQLENALKFLFTGQPDRINYFHARITETFDNIFWNCPLPIKQ